MSNLLIKQKISDRELFNTYLDKYQKDHVNAKFPDKTRHDRIDCVICGGCYSRQMRHVHLLSKKHNHAVDTLYGKIYNKV